MQYLPSTNYACANFTLYSFSQKLQATFKSRMQITSPEKSDSASRLPSCCRGGTRTANQQPAWAVFSPSCILVCLSPLSVNALSVALCLSLGQPPWVCGWEEDKGEPRRNDAFLGSQRLCKALQMPPQAVRFQHFLQLTVLVLSGPDGASPQHTLMLQICLLRPGL